MKKLKEMMEKKDKKMIANLITAIAIGLLLIICGSTFFTNKEEKQTVDGKAASPETTISSSISYEDELETELEEFLETVEGVGDVEVMITLTNRGEIVVAQDTIGNSSKVMEEDSQGGAREQQDMNQTITNKTISGENGYEEPMVLQEKEPEIEGVIIAAEGGGDILIQAQLIMAAQTVLGVEPYKVQVLKMENNNE